MYLSQQAYKSTTSAAAALVAAPLFGVVLVASLITGARWLYPQFSPLLQLMVAKYSWHVPNCFGTRARGGLMRWFPILVGGVLDCLLPLGLPGDEIREESRALFFLSSSTLAESLILSRLWLSRHSTSYLHELLWTSAYSYDLARGSADFEPARYLLSLLQGPTLGFPTFTAMEALPLRDIS